MSADKVEGTLAFQGSLLEILVGGEFSIPDVPLGGNQAHTESWLFLEEHKKTNRTIYGQISAVIKGGIVVNVSGLRGFVPDSQLRLRTGAEELIGTQIPLKILEINAKRNKLILSHRLVIQEEKATQRGELLQKLQAGQIVSGEVVRIADFGAFVDVGGLDGLLPISEISWERISHPSDVLKVGQVINTKLLKVDTEKGHVALSLKRA